MKKEQSLIKILVCDDDPQDRKLIRAYLNQNTDREMVMLEAGRTDEIQTALDKGRVDLVLMDIQMPGKSGVEWLEEIVAKQAAPVVMLTGHGNEELAVQSLQQGAVGYLPKSNLSSGKLIETIDSAIEKWRGMILSQANQEELERMVNIDSLTGLLNKRAVMQKLDDQITQARRYQEDLAILMLDIDHFKRVNDTYGHITGDDVLEKVGTSLQASVREADIAGRYGGEEFVAVLPNTDLSDAMVVAERIRQRINALEMKDLKGDSFSITVSQGLANYEPGDERSSLLSRADNALYAAKDNGRDRIETSEPVSSGI